MSDGNDAGSARIVVQLHMSESAPAIPDVVFDCNIFLQASLGTNGAAAQCLRLLGTGAYTLFVSRDVLDEIQDVFSRPLLQERFPALTPESLTDLLHLLERFAILIHNIPETFRYARDPDDEPYVNLALVTGVQYLVTLDKDLLDLMTDKTEESQRFHQRFPHLTILGPADFLRVLDSPPSA